MTLPFSTVRKWCPSQNPQGLGSLYLRCITKRWSTIDPFAPYTWHTNILFNPFTNGQCWNNLSQNVELIQVFQHTNGCQRTNFEWTQIILWACLPLSSQSKYLHAHLSQWHVTHGLFNVVCLCVYTLAKAKNYWSLYFTDSLFLIQWGRCYHRVGIPGTKHPPKFYSVLLGQKHDIEVKNIWRRQSLLMNLETVLGSV